MDALPLEVARAEPGVRDRPDWQWSIYERFVNARLKWMSYEAESQA